MQISLLSMKNNRNVKTPESIDSGVFFINKTPSLRTGLVVFSEREADQRINLSWMVLTARSASFLSIRTEIFISLVDII